MAKSSTGCGCGALLGIGATLLVGFVANDTAKTMGVSDNNAMLIGIGSAVAVLLISVWAVSSFGKSTPDKCGLCGGPIKRSARMYERNGRKFVACANCSRGIDKENSRRAVQRLMEK